MGAAEARGASLIGPEGEEEGEQGRGEEEEPRASARAVTLNFITGGLGSSMFSLPWSVAGSSVIASVAVVASMLLVNAWTISIVVRAGERYGVFDLGGIVAKFPHGIGRPLQVVTNVFIWVTLFLSLVSYIIVIRDSAGRFAIGTCLESRHLIVVLASLFVLPLCFLSQRLLERTSSLAIAVNAYLFGLVMILYGKGLSNDTLPDGCCILGTTLRGNVALASVMFSAVVIQMCVLPMYQALEDRSPEKFDRIIAVSFSVLFFLFCGFSSVGYLLFGPAVKSNLLENLPRGPASSVAQVGTMLVVACVYPIMVYPMVAPIRAWGGSFCGLGRGGALAVTKCLIVLAVMGVAACVDKLGVVNILNGAISAMVFVALAPSCIGLILMDFGKVHKLALAFLLVGGISISSMGLLFTENYAADLKCSIAA